MSVLILKSSFIYSLNEQVISWVCEIYVSGLLPVESPAQTRLDILGPKLCKSLHSSMFPPYWEILCFLPLTVTL